MTKYKVNDRYSQSKNLGPLLSEMFLCDLFNLFINTDIANYGDDNTPHSSNKYFGHRKVIFYSYNLPKTFWRLIQQKNIYL